MSKKEKNKEVKKEEAVFKYGVAPVLLINMVKENRLYRFEMPVGAQLTECEEACTECLNIVKKMLKEAEEKRAEAEAKEKEENESSVNEVQEDVTESFEDFTEK